MGAAGPQERGMGVGIWVAVLCAVLAVPLLTTLAPEVRHRLRAAARRAPVLAHALGVRHEAVFSHAAAARGRQGWRCRGARADSGAARSLASRQLTSEVSVGIDLGTTFSVVAVCQHGQVSVVEARALATR
jgi:rhodanese-related sulfurtransferase